MITLDAPHGTDYHWVVVNLPAATTDATALDDAFTAMEKTTIAAGILTGLVTH